MAVILENALSKSVRKRLLKKNKDKDSDGIYDRFEKKKFKTSPGSTDTDGDGFIDGEEVFNLLSDPLDPLSPAPDAE